MANSNIGIGDGDARTSDAVDHRLDVLEHVSADLHAGTAATGWTAATNAAQGGIRITRGSILLDGLQALTDDDWALVDPSPAGAHIAVRIPTGANPAQYRLNYVGRLPDEIYLPVLTTFTRRGESTNGNWQFFVSRDFTGQDVVRLELQVTSDASAIGSSTFVGNLDKTKVYEIVKQILQGNVTANDTAETLTV